VCVCVCVCVFVCVCVCVDMCVCVGLSVGVCVGVGACALAAMPGQGYVPLHMRECVFGCAQVRVVCVFVCCMCWCEHQSIVQICTQQDRLCLPTHETQHVCNVATVPLLLTLSQNPSEAEERGSSWGERRVHKVETVVATRNGHCTETLFKVYIV